MTLINFFRRNKWELGGAFLLVAGVFANLFPQGHVILGGDVLQVLNLSENFGHYYSFDWFRQAIFFYSIFYLLDLVGFTDTAQISWYLGIFLLGAYLSFLIFCQLLFPVSRGITRTLGALFYATNLYTLYIFTATWGYLSYQSLYLFVPVVTGLYVRSLMAREWRYVWWLLVAIFCASMGFSNPAFALAFGIFLCLLTMLLFLYRQVPLRLFSFAKIGLIALGAFLMNAYWIFPVIPQLQEGIHEVYTSEFVDLGERLRKTSNAIFDTIRLLPTSEQERYYPENFPYPQVSWMEEYVSVLAFIPFFLVVVGFFQKRNIYERKMYGIFFMLFLLFVVLVARIRFPFDTINEVLFQLPGLNTLRGWDKTATFTPFILASLLVLLLIYCQKTRAAKLVFGGFLVLTIILALPFYIGGLQTKLSYILSGQKAKDFSKAKQSALVEVPKDYLQAIPILGGDTQKNKVAMLPYSPGSSVGRVSFPEWKVNGPYIVKDLYKKQYIELYGYYIPGWMFAEEFENKIHDPQWIIDLYGLLGVKYLFYHKDAKARSIEEMEDARKYLEKIKALERVVENDSFFLYTLSEERVFPYVYIGINIPQIETSPEKLSYQIAMLREKVRAVNYEERGVKNVIIPVEHLDQGTVVFLNEASNLLWRAKYQSSEGQEILLRRDATIRYANGWVIDRALEGGFIEVYFLPMRFFKYGLYVSLGAIVFVIFGLVWSRIRDKY